MKRSRLPVQISSLRAEVVIDDVVEVHVVGADRVPVLVDDARIWRVFSPNEPAGRGIPDDGEPCASSPGPRR